MPLINPAETARPTWCPLPITIEAPAKTAAEYAERHGFTELTEAERLANIDREGHSSEILGDEVTRVLVAAQALCRCEDGEGDQADVAPCKRHMERLREALRGLDGGNDG